MAIGLYEVVSQAIVDLDEGRTRLDRYSELRRTHAQEYQQLIMGHQRHAFEYVEEKCISYQRLCYTTCGGS